MILRLIKVSRLCDTSWFLNKEKYHYLIFLHKGRFIRAQWDSWSWFWHSRLGMSRPGIDHGLDWILKSIPVLILVLNKINDLAELRSSWSWFRSSRLGLSWPCIDMTKFSIQDKSWSWKKLVVSLSSVTDYAATGRKWFLNEWLCYSQLTGFPFKGGARTVHCYYWSAWI